MTRTLTPEDLAALFDAFNRHDIDAVMAYFAEDCVFDAVAGPEAYGTRHEGSAAIARMLSLSSGVSMNAPRPPSLQRLSTYRSPARATPAP